MNTHTLARNLQAARILIPEHRYLLLCGIIAAASSLLWVLFWTVCYFLHVTDILPVNPGPGIILLFTVIIPAGVFMFAFFYPAMTASGRKTKINTDLPYAVTYMQALSTTLPLYDIFRSVYESDDLYGEVSKECGLIVRDVELFGTDLITAMENTRTVTPSEKFSELLNDLIMVFRSGGDIVGFFSAKSASYRETAQAELESSMQFLEIIAEVYVTVFVAGPIAMMIMLVAQSLSGTASVGNLMPVLYFGLPLGAVTIIAILYFMLPGNSLSITRKEIRYTEFSPDIIAVSGRTVTPAFKKKIQKIQTFEHIKKFIRHPVISYSSNYGISAVCGIILVFSVFLCWNTGWIQTLFSSSSPLLLISLAIIAGMIPTAAAYEIRSRYVSRIDRQLPEFLREISDMRDIGMTLQSAIVLISKNKSGVLSSELKLVSHELEYGSSLSGALVRMENRVGLTNVKRAVSLLVRASEVTDYIREILAIAVSDLHHYLKMKNRRFNAAFVYVAIVYISFGIYLFTALIILDRFVASFSGMNVSFNLAGSTQDMFIVAIILAAFSGIMAGQMSANSPLAGLKHSIIMLILTIILFIFIL